MNAFEKLTIIVDAITEAHDDFIKGSSFIQLPKMYDHILKAYLKVTNSQEGLIFIFDKPANTIRLVVSACSNPILQNQIDDYFKKIETGDSHWTNFQETLFNRLIQSQKTVVDESVLSPNELLPEMLIRNYLGIPLISQNKILGVVYLFNMMDPYEQMTLSHMIALHQSCIIMAVGYHMEQMNKEALRLMKIKDEMLDMYLNKLEKQNIELAQAKKAADFANQAKSVFITNLGHEFRTPLTTIMGTTELLLLSPLNEKQTKSAQTIYSSAELLLALMNDLLDISKIEAGEMKMEFIPIDLPQLIEEVASLFTLKAYQKDIEFNVSLDPKIPTLIQGDPVRIRQVLLNLLGNAFKFTNQGYVMLTILLQKNDRIRFEIKDTGIGISADGKEKLFKKFSQLDTSTSRKFGGTGLGLAISKQLVELMDGTIGYSSEENAGSTFWFELPLKGSPKPIKDVTEEMNNLLKDTSVCIVSLHEVSRNLIAFYLQNTPVVVKTCKDLSQFCDILMEKGSQENQREFVIIDCKMIFSNQIKLWGLIKQLLRTHEVKVIILASEQEALSEKINVLQEFSPIILPKPFLQKDLIHILIKKEPQA